MSHRSKRSISSESTKSSRSKASKSSAYTAPAEGESRAKTNALSSTLRYGASLKKMFTDISALKRDEDKIAQSLHICLEDLSSIRKIIGRGNGKLVLDALDSAEACNASPSDTEGEKDRSNPAWLVAERQETIKYDMGMRAAKTNFRCLLEPIKNNARYRLVTNLLTIYFLKSLTRWDFLRYYVTLRDTALYMRKVHRICVSHQPPSWR